jgi:hypothetical protein
VLVLWVFLVGSPERRIVMAEVKKAEVKPPVKRDRDYFTLRLKKAESEPEKEKK